MSLVPPLLPPVGPQRLIFTVRAVEDRWGVREFAAVPWAVYAGDRYWASPLARERLRGLYPEYNPQLSGQEPGLFIAEARNPAWADTAVGSIAAWFDPARLTEEAGITAAFGLFEVANEPDMAEALFDAAETWLFEHTPGLSAITGPLSLDPLLPPGLLVDGFNVRHGAFLPYNPPYYVELVETAGYEPAQELYAYTLALDAPPPVPAHITIRRGADLRSALPAVAALYRATETPESEPLPGLADLLDAAASARYGLEGRLAQGWLREQMMVATLQEDGEIVAAAVALPDTGSALRPWRGRLLPFGWLSYRLALHRSASLRIFPALVHREQERVGAAAALYAGLAAAAAQHGCRRAVFGPILADDADARGVLTSLGAHRTATYCVYRKTY